MNISLLLIAIALAVSLSPATASGTGGQAAGAGTSARPARPAYVPPIKHVFLINIENKGYTQTFGDGSKAPYLAGKLRRKGVLLNSFYAQLADTIL